MITSSKKLSLALAVSILVAASLALVGAAPEEASIVLPEDVDVVNMQGNGFNLQLTQINNIKEKWQKLTDEAATVETPRPISGEDSARLNVDMFEKIIAEQKRIREQGGDKTSRPIDPSAHYLGSLYAYTRPDFDGTRRISRELSDWIKQRAELILQRYESYSRELDTMDTKREPGRVIVINILLLNTFVDLKNVANEKFDSTYKGIAWLKKAMKRLERDNRYNSSKAAITQWLEDRFSSVRATERLSINTPNYEWVANMRDIKRFLHEQKFSEELAIKCNEFMAGQWQGFPRSRWFDSYKDDLSAGHNAYGTLYHAFRGQLAFNLPFSVQDSVLRGY